jgi:hypothetical protein
MASGGYIEHTEIDIKLLCDDDTRHPESQIQALADNAAAMSAAHGNQFDPAGDMATFMTEAGFVDVKELRFKLPLGWWSADSKYKEIGTFFERYYKTGMQGWLMQVYTKAMGVSVSPVFFRSC